MALVIKDRVQETTTTTGTGTFTLNGAVVGFQSFSVIGNGNTTYYAIVYGSDFEIGIGTYTSSGTTLSRDTILSSSNNNNAVDFGAGTKNIFVTYPASKSVNLDSSNNLNLSGIFKVDNIQSFTTNTITIATNETLKVDKLQSSSTSTITIGTNETLKVDKLQSSSTSTITIGTGETLKVDKLQSSSTSTITISDGNTLDLAAGTTSTAPLEFVSGSFLTSSTAGAVEYNGKIFTTSPVASKRGLSPSTMLRYNTSTVTISNTSTLQDWLGTVDVSVAALTAYKYKGMFRMSRAAGVTSHTVNLGFAGTATLTAINYLVVATTTTGNVLGTPQMRYIATASSTAVTAASIISTENNVVFIEGIAQIDGAGTFIPQVGFSAAPGGDGTIAVGAYFEMTPIGVNNDTINIGDWA
jgi:hypothetical protein